MNSLEDALRDALSARATTLTPDPKAYERIVERRRRAPRWSLPIGAIAVTTTVAAIVALAGGVGSHRAAPANTNAPDRAVVIRDFKAYVVLGGALDTVLATTTRQDGNVVAVAAAGDGRNFYIASQYTTKCKSALYRLDGTNGSTAEVAGFWSQGYVTGLAVTPDRRTLVYATSLNSDCGTAPSVHLRDLLTGTERVWRGTNQSGFLTDVTVSPDGRHVAYMEDMHVVRRIDTRQPGPLPENEDSEVRTYGGHCYTHAPSYLRTGELAVVAVCEPIGPGERRTDVRIFDPARNRLGRVLFTVPRGFDPKYLTFDASGRHAFLTGTSTGVMANDGVVYRWDAGATLRRVHGARPVLTMPVW